MRIEARIRLVEQHELRVVDEGAGNREALLHAAREGTSTIVRAMVELDQAQQLVDASARFRSLQPVQARKERQVLTCGQIAVKHRLVRDETDAGTQNVGLFKGVDTENPQLTASRPRQKGKLAQKRGLSGAIGAKDGEERALWQLQVEAVERTAAAELLDEPSGLNGVRRCGFGDRTTHAAHPRHKIRPHARARRLPKAAWRDGARTRARCPAWRSRHPPT